MLALPLAVYASIGLFFLVQTYVEGISSKEGGPALRVFGLLLCLVWPVILLGVTIEVLRARFLFGSANKHSPHIPVPRSTRSCSRFGIPPRTPRTEQTGRAGRSTEDLPPT
jgi:hypothetical protein